jgi:uncharacterized protein (DUF2164 family)
MAIKLSAETTKQLIASIKRYAAANLDEEIGDLKAGLLLDYCLKEIGPTIYNQAIARRPGLLHRTNSRPRRRLSRG